MTDTAPQASSAQPPVREVRVHLDEWLRRRGMTAAELSERVGIHPNNLSVLRQGKFSMLRRTTLTALCRELECQPGDLLTYE